MDAEGNSKGAITVETDLVSGKKTLTKTDAEGKVQFTLERNKTKDKNGNTVIKTDTFNASGIQTEFLTVVKDEAGKLLEKFKVDLATNKKTDLLTGLISDYKPKKP